MSDLQDKIKQAEQTLRLAAEMSEYYYNKPLIICYSGGKDSDVMLDIAKRCLNANQFEVLNSHTTVDAPETVYHIRAVFKDCKRLGINTIIKMPLYKGHPTSMWRLIEEMGVPPTRISRYCCRVLKEVSTPNRLIAVGVREGESSGRKGKEVFSTRGKTKKDAEYRTLQHTYAMFQMDKSKKNAYECEIIKACKKHQDTISYPIYRFTDNEVWEYVKKFNVSMNPLYAKGYKRVGCIGCPLGGEKQQNKQFSDYPQFKKNYIKAFDRTIIKRIREGKKNTFKNGEEWFRWWIGENPKQVRIEDFFEKGGAE